MFISEDDIKRTISIVSKEIEKRGLTFLDGDKEKIAVELLNISYSKGGDYTEATINVFASIYFDNELYKKSH